VLLTSDDGGGLGAPPTTDLASGAVQRVDPDTGKLVATIHTQGEPLDLAVSSGEVWAVDSDRRVLHRVDPSTGEAVISGPGVHPILGLASLATASSSLWLGAYGGDGQGLVVRLAPDSANGPSPIDLRRLALQSGDPPPPVNALAQLIPAPRSPASSAFTGWVLDAAEGSLRELHAGSAPALSPPLDLGGEPLVAAADDRDLWVGLEDALVKVVAGRVAERTALPGRPVALATVADGIWVATADGRLVRVERDGTVARVARTQGRPIDLELGEGSLWLLRPDGLLTKHDPSTGETIASESVGSNAVALAVGEDFVWVALRGGRQLERANLPSLLKPTDRFGITVPDNDCALNTLEIACRIGLGFHLRARDGTRASYHGAWRELRKRGREQTCQGKTFKGRYMASSDVRTDVGNGVIWIERWGTLALRWERMIVVAAEIPSGMAGGPVCGDGIGTWIAIAGPLKGERGEFTFPGRIRGPNPIPPVRPVAIPESFTLR
jgi:hypothetical protein